MSGAGEGSGGGRAARLPRWTRQEILVLIEGKRVVEARGRGRGGRGAGGLAGAEPTKWAAVAEYCRRHGVERGPVQCRKRWSNLAGDYKKIREWERSLLLPSGGKEVSFWAMRNDARRERRLPGFFDREVYDIIEGRGGSRNAAAQAQVVVVEEEGKEKPAQALNSGRGVPEEGLFTSSSASSEDDDDEASVAPPAPVLPSPSPSPAPAHAVVAVTVPDKKNEAPVQDSSEKATSKGKQQEQIMDDPPPEQGGQKRQRSDDTTGEATDLQGQLIEILDQSSRMVAAQLEAQNINCQLDREQRKDQVSSLLSVLGKVADALYRIADKL
ncbi:trihelix transcription factor ASR3 isoform X2 [Brachypodium distachyon]|uniref:Myb-like domain-containing protein n=1 Tax=Brachypodium distachyon TaxID=15368 RepID=I1IX91_BRADI|nr:trihelix transcription factor ASR3 isoform X2 [Brachypodium distachyon]KQJ82369.1 hypothetical protein BRADI_5g08600v3 [Brachypodium distachyon]|eukprot:XP_010239837.1 trihelix transcription factor ASR3 isoform X2 [Brachypodium distachyon]